MSPRTNSFRTRLGRWCALPVLALLPNVSCGEPIAEFVRVPTAAGGELRVVQQAQVQLESGQSALFLKFRSDVDCAFTPNKELTAAREEIRRAFEHVRPAAEGKVPVIVIRISNQRVEDWVKVGDEFQVVYVKDPKKGWVSRDDPDQKVYSTEMSS